MIFKILILVIFSMFFGDYIKAEEPLKTLKRSVCTETPNYVKSKNKQGITIPEPEEVYKNLRILIDQGKFEDKEAKEVYEKAAEIDIFNAGVYYKAIYFLFDNNPGWLELALEAEKSAIEKDCPENIGYHLGIIITILEFQNKCQEALEKCKEILKKYPDVANSIHTCREHVKGKDPCQENNKGFLEKAWGARGPIALCIATLSAAWLIKSKCSRKN